MNWIRYNLGSATGFIFVSVVLLYVIVHSH